MDGGMHMREIQDYLGHAFITTTQIYTHPERGNINAKHAEIFDESSSVTRKVVKNGDRTTIEYNIPQDFDHKSALKRLDAAMQSMSVAPA
jgi:hypothetical protein